VKRLFALLLIAGVIGLVVSLRGAERDAGSHLPLAIGGTGRGQAAEPTAEALKVDVLATVRFDGGAFEITNRNRWDWMKPTLTVNGLYRLSVSRMAAGQTYRARCGQLRDAHARPYVPRHEPPRSFSISCTDAEGMLGWYRGTWPAER